MKRVIMIVLDSVGAGALPDADKYGDVGANTLGHIWEQAHPDLPYMEKMGLGRIEGLGYPVPEKTAGAFGRAIEVSAGKDTTTGHWEMAGAESEKALPVYPNGFPPELIRAFEEKTGRKTLCNKPYSGTQVIRDYGEEHMRTGALIVFERSTGLGDVIDSGTIIDAEISDPLIENIFEPNTPLHDGAMIIRDERIVAAACILQLSDNYTISRELGTRHRAALGMTQECDAVVVVVSEERGEISVAMKGELVRSLDATRLRQVLNDIL